jgi:hypothetical protein
VLQFLIDTENLIVMFSQPKSSFLSVRLPDRMRTKFHAKAKKFGKPSEVLRELIDAFVEDRVTIQPPVTRNSKENFYVTRSED